MKAGFIGLGTMGQHMAANLQAAGHNLVVHDVRRAAAEPHLAAGAVWADTPAEVMAAANVVFTSLPTPAVVEEVALGPSGLLQSARQGKVLFDLSTNSPTTVRQIEQAFRARGAVVCDAPVSGGPSGARTRKLSVYVGGDRDTFDSHRDLLSGFSDEQLYVGPIGSGTVVKLAHNCVGYMINVAIAEVFTLGVRGGVDPLDLWHALRMGSVGRPAHLRCPGHAVPEPLVRRPGVQPAAGAQGRGTGDRVRARAGDPDADGGPHVRRDDGGARPWLGRPGLARGDAAPRGTNRRAYRDPGGNPAAGTQWMSRERTT